MYRFRVIMGACSNRRGVHRYSIRAPLRWEGVESRDRGEGLTENISTRGVYFLGDRPMAVGQSVLVNGSSSNGVGVWLEEVLPLPDAL